MGLFLRLHDIQHNNSGHKGPICDTQHKLYSTQVTFSITLLEIECHYAEYINLNFIMLNVIKLSVDVQNVVASCIQLAMSQPTSGSFKYKVLIVYAWK